MRPCGERRKARGGHARDRNRSRVDFFGGEKC